MLLNHLFKQKTEWGQEWTPMKLHNQMRETAKPHPEYDRTGTFLLGNF